MKSMLTWQDNQRPFARKVAGPLAIVFAMFYLGFHAVSGERGLFALFAETRRLATLKTELAEVKQRRQALEHKTKLLSNDSLDVDMLDEQLRRIAGKAGKDEILYLPKQDAKP